MYQENLKLYDEAVLLNNRFKRKGKSTAFTSSNGYMFSFLNKDAQLGIRLSKENIEHFHKKFTDENFISNGAVMKEFVVIPNFLLTDTTLLSSWLDKSFDYVNSLPLK